MLMADLLHSCTDEGIAAAAVASIGGPFARSIRAEAERRGLSVGALTASLVSGFARNASERDWRDLALAMSGSDVPVLTGLEAMANHALRHRDPAARPLPTRGAVPVGRPDAVAWPVALS